MIYCDGGGYPQRAAFWKGKIDGEVLLELYDTPRSPASLNTFVCSALMLFRCRTDGDFTGEGCKWSGLCRMPFAAVKKVLSRTRKLAAEQDDAHYTLSSSDGTAE